MDPTKQRIAIAEACGWKPEVRKMYAGEKNCKGWGFNTHLSEGSPERDFTSSPTRFPDYLNSLDAMHEAEVLHQFHKDIEGRLAPNSFTYWHALLDVAHRGGNNLHSATAPQRAEAFLRTLNLWKA